MYPIRYAKPRGSSPSLLHIPWHSNLRITASTEGFHHTYTRRQQKFPRFQQGSSFLAATPSECTLKCAIRRRHHPSLGMHCHPRIRPRTQTGTRVVRLQIQLTKESVQDFRPQKRVCPLWAVTCLSLGSG